MRIESAPNFASLTTFAATAQAARCIHLEHENDWRRLPAVLGGRRWLLLGEGSNTVVTEDLDADAVRVATPGIERLATDAEGVQLRISAGVNWHRLVRLSLDWGLSGLENLALIPGSCGAAPVQNIGAYGRELAQFLTAVDVIDTERDWLYTQLATKDCDFGYRDSIFKQQPGRFLIRAIHLHLPRALPCTTHYAGLAEWLAERGLKPTPQHVFSAVCAIRRSKLPDPAQLGNAGSFFKNPVVAGDERVRLQALLPGMNAHRQEDGSYKLSAAQLIDGAGLKGQNFGAVGVSEQHALVLVNRGAASGADVLHAVTAVRERVQQRFGVELEVEPRLLNESSLFSAPS